MVIALNRPAVTASRRSLLTRLADAAAAARGTGGDVVVVRGLGRRRIEQATTLRSRLRHHGLHVIEIDASDAINAARCCPPDICAVIDLGPAGRREARLLAVHLNVALIAVVESPGTQLSNRQDLWMKIF
ncbi:hypothetical protein [Pseudonocardia sp. H11422]|uniref:hypothetical protein n=1 Tax=Pseudonocardia sp. H11422 TaxID=2835866 RepID=UPI001BDC4EAF|nr:hypothetical protein [Pseudonocardia sp. H11422]